MNSSSNSEMKIENLDCISQSKYIWTAKAEEKLKELHVLQQGNWKSISTILNGPTPLECMYKWQQMHPDQAPSRQLWSPEEDEQLKELVQKFGKKWSRICTVMNWRTGKQVRERYLNQLQGTINQEKWSEEEDKLILKLYKKFGTKWSYISSFLSGRPENMVKNRFYANLKRRYQCDLGDSDDEDYEENSNNSQSNDKKKKRRKVFKLTKDNLRLKKVNIQEGNIEQFQRMTRSKDSKQLDDSNKHESHFEEQNNENNSGPQNLTSYQSQANNQLVKEEYIKFTNQTVNNSPQQQQCQHQESTSLTQVQMENLIKQYQMIQNLDNASHIKQNIQQNIILPNILLSQQKQSCYDLQLLQYLNSINTLAPFFGIAQLQQQLLAPLQIQNQLKSQLDQIQQWNQFYQQFNKQILQSDLQTNNNQNQGQ